MAFAGPPAIAVRRASCDKGGGEILDGGGVDTDFGAADLLDVWGVSISSAVEELLSKGINPASSAGGIALLSACSTARRDNTPAYPKRLSLSAWLRVTR